MSTVENIVHVDDDTYEDTVEEERLVLLDFWAEWCGPCKALEPVLEDIAESYPELTLAKIDADENEAAMDAFGIQSIPTMILFSRGEPVEVFAGKVPYPKIEREVRERV